MTGGELLAFFDSKTPFALAEAWDNCGLQIGSLSQHIGCVVAALDVCKSVLDDAPVGSAIVVHHPLFFAPLKSIDLDSWQGELVRTAIQKELCIIALHTNFDKTHLGRYVFGEVLGFENSAEDGFLRYCDLDMEFEELVEHCKHSFKVQNLSCVPTKKRIKKVALCTGSGGSFVGKTDADVLITGDVKYHERFAAAQIGQGVIDVGHYETERYFCDALTQMLKILPLEVIISDSKNPTQTYP